MRTERPSLYQGYPACLVCGSTRLSEACSADEMARDGALRTALHPDPPPTQRYPARLLKCDNCGTLARDPQLTEAAALDAYREDPYHTEWLATAHDQLRLQFQERMPALKKWVGDAASVLEVGSFAGGFLSAAGAAGWTARGIDVGRCVVDFTQRLGLDVALGTLESAGLPARSFDAVFVWFCFDQLPAPRRALTEIYRLLKPRGRLLVRVPNGGFFRWMQRIRHAAPRSPAERAASRLLALTGLSSFPFRIGYTPQGLEWMFRSNGFDAIRVDSDVNLRPCPEDGLRCAARVLARLLDRASFGRISLGPWIEMSGQKTAG